MIALIVGSTLVGGLLVTWYGRRTMVRIQNWGEKMNEIDAIFQSVATPEEMSGHAVPAETNGAPAQGVAPASRSSRRHAQFGSGVPHGTV